MKADENIASECLFFRIANAVVTSGLIKNMTAVEIKVYLTLAQHANWQTGWAYPSIRRLRDLTGASLTSIIKAVRRLVGFGLICAERNGRRFPQLDPRQMVYQVFRTPQAFPEDRSSGWNDLRGKEESTMLRKPESRQDAISGAFTGGAGETGGQNGGHPPQAFPEDRSSGWNDLRGKEESTMLRKRTLQASPEDRSSGTETYCSSRTETSCSSRTEHNKNYELKDLNENAGSKPPEPSFKPKIISDDTIQKIIEARGRDYALKVLRDGNYAIPPFLLEGESQ